MKQKMFLCVSMMFLMMALAACSSKEPDADPPSVSQSFEVSQGEREETSETPAAANKITEVDDVIVTTQEASVRTGPGTDYDVIASISAGVVFERTGVAGDWSRILYDGKTAYIYTGLTVVRPSYTVEEASGSLVVTAEEASIRNGAGTKYDVLYTAKAGEQFTVTGMTDMGWYEILYEDQTAYIYGDLVEASVEGTAAGPAAETIG